MKMRRSSQKGLAIISFCVLVTSCGKKINPELIASAKTFDIPIIRDLVNSGGDPNFQDNSGKTALHWICLAHNSKPEETEQIISFLVEHGSDINTQDNDGNTSLFYAIKSGNFEATSSLVHHGANINIKNKELRTAFFPAVSLVKAENPEINGMKFVRLLFEAGADILIKDREQKNLIHASKNPEVTAWLIEKGLDPKERDKYGKTPLDYSSAEIFKLRDSITGFSPTKSNKE